MEINVVKSWSYTNVEVVKVSHTWTISNFRFCEEKPGEVLKSPSFSAGAAGNKINWCIWLYPNGDKDGNKDHVSIFLHLVSSNKAEIRAKGKFAIYNDKNEEDGLSTFQIDNVFKDGGSWGRSKFIKRDFLLDNTNRLLPDDKLTILSEVTVRDTVNVPREGLSLTLKDPASSLLENLAFLFDTQKLSDVVLVAGGREFKVHKAILAARSAVFSAMFEHEMQEQKHNRVDIIDVDGEVVEEMLRFIYTGKVLNIKKIADSLLVAADKYALDSLKLMCQEPLSKSLTTENAAHILILADDHNCNWLKTQTINFINMHTTDVMDTEDFKFMVTSHPHLVVEILRALAIKSSGHLDTPMLSTIRKDTPQ